ncbi:tetratricopeptide repeat protein [Leptolyngbya sp. AN02str]|uniref:tetratricopeptide repeat protein n=1 Tax=Leptolyngbya sp. AN02str TaxID=3423363 RepID=UPI003D320230
MADIYSRKILGHNQQMYLRLKVALSLSLRRQIFVAVCDDLPMRDRLARQLEVDLLHTAAFTGGSSLDSLRDRTGDGMRREYPRLVTVSLDVRNPNPVGQMAQWLSQHPPPLVGKRRLPMPAFQFVGIERLTRQPAAIQRVFLTNLQSIERSLPMLDSTLLVWMPQPWFRMVQQSAQEFWRCRTAVFEFVGEPKALSDDSALTHAQQVQSSPVEVGTRTERATDAQLADLPKKADPAKKTVNHQNHQNHQERAIASQAHVLTVTQLTISSPLPRETAQAAIATTVIQPTGIIQPTGTAIAASLAVPKSQHPQPAQRPASLLIQTPAVVLAQPPRFALNIPADDYPAMRQAEHIEQLHRQSSKPAELAAAYRSLGDLYRDRIEQGNTAPHTVTLAIEAYEQALVWLAETSPLWVDILNDLGNLSWMRSRSADTSEEAIAQLNHSIRSYRSALKRLNPQTQSAHCAMVYNNLGSAYADLARHQEPIVNLQHSAAAYQQALAHQQPQTDPAGYASTQNNLGTTLWNLAQHQQPETYIRQAIAAYTEALYYSTPEADILHYGMIQNNLGTAYWNLAQYDTPQSMLTMAISAYRIALRYRTREQVPLAYAATQNNLGTAFWHLLNAEQYDAELRFEYLTQVIDAYTASLNTVQDVLAQSPATTFSFDPSATHTNLALAHQRIAEDEQLNLSSEERTVHREAALGHHLQALQGWSHNPKLRQAAMSHVIQMVRKCYERGGIDGQNRALSHLPAELLPEVLGRIS